MKLVTAPQNVNVHGDFKTSDFNVGDVAFIVDMFADKVYSHKERAIIRELSCNAHDSHVIAGTQDIPFRVHLPTTLEPWFSVRDFGTGLSDYDVRNIFAGIGISTKRNNNDVIGCFGIGSLSPYSVADSFTVISYHDGMMRTYSCYRDELRKPVVALLTESETNELNGLEVSVSINGKVDTFHSEAEHVFRFWEGTLPLINDRRIMDECKNQRERYAFKGDNFGLSFQYGEMRAVMGNISYKIPYELDEFRCDGYIKFNLGELEFDTARENLSMTDKVRAAIKNKFQIIKSQLCELATQKLQSEKTDYDRAVLADILDRGQLAILLRKAELKQYGLPQPQEHFEVWNARHRSSECMRTKYVPLGSDVEYYTYKDRMTNRIKSYVKESNHVRKLVVFKDVAQAAECKVPLELLKDLDNLPKVQRSPRTSKGTNNVQSFVFVGGKSFNAPKCWQDYELEIGPEEIVYVEISRFMPVSTSIISSSNYNIVSTQETLAECGVAVPKVIGLKTTFLSTKKFKNGNFITYDDYVRRELTKIAPDSYYEYDGVKLNMLERIDQYIDHPEINSILSLVKSPKNTIIAQVCRNIKILKDITADDTAQNLIEEFFNKYIMLTFVSLYDLSRSNHANIQAVAKYISGKVK